MFLGVDLCLVQYWCVELEFSRGCGYGVHMTVGSQPGRLFAATRPFFTAANAEDVPEAGNGEQESPNDSARDH